MECLFPYSFSLNELEDRVRQANIQFVLINAPAGHWEAGERGLAIDPSKRDRFRKSIEVALKYANTLKVNQVHVLAGQVHDGQFEKAMDSFLFNLNWLCEQTKTESIYWNIEPINTRDIPDYFLTHQSQAHEIVCAVGSDRLRVQMDLYHCQIMEGDIVTKLNQYLPTNRVGHIQIAGVPERNEPSQSELDYIRVLQELNRLGYDAYIGCEYRPKLGTREGLAWLKNSLFSGTM